MNYNLCDGLTLQKKSDGHWLCVDGGTLKGMICLENNTDGIFGKAMLKWAQEFDDSYRYAKHDCVSIDEEIILDNEGEINRNDLKWDDGKLKFSLILPEFEKLMAEILTKGEINHPRVAGEPSWQRVEPEAYINAMKRHISSFQLGESIDSDMDTHHMGHVAINAMFLYWLDMRGKSDDKA